MLLFYTTLLSILALPLGCRNFIGPHTLECLETLWYQVGCVGAGLKLPNKLTREEIRTFNNLTIK